MKYDGAYYLIDQPLIRVSHGNEHSVDLDETIPASVINAVNIIQSVPYRVNGFVNEVLNTVVADGLTLGGIPEADPLPIEASIGEKQWATMTSEQKGDFKVKRRTVYEYNAKLVNKRRNLFTKLDIAGKLVNRGEFYYPHFLDFRSRVYPMDQTGMHPQADDLGKSLLMFAEGKELTDAGLYWLMVRLANSFGEDKLPLDERVAWVQRNYPLILDSANNPIDGERFWCEADDPWQFLATAHEYAMSHREGSRFVSHLPIPIDASCSGIQHLSALGRDPQGALATNMRDVETREDLYIHVQKEVMAQVSTDAVNGNPEAIAWAGKITRSTVKRAVMTTPYGVTPEGIRQQLITDGYVDDIEGSVNKNAAYLRDCITNAMSNVADKPKAIMAWLQGSAFALGEADIPFMFTAPSGFKVKQAYWETSRKRVNTIMGRWSDTVQCGERTLIARKQALAAAPNFVHAHDASHLMATAVRMHDDMGMKSLSFIHDSFATHACDTPMLNVVLRQEFIKQYTPDRLALLAEEMDSYAPNVALPAPPELGDFDISEVMGADYFFA